MSGQIRLACCECDRDDFDGVDELPTDWSDITEEQSLQDALAEVSTGDPRKSIFEWHTHLGLCPECQTFDDD